MFCWCAMLIYRNTRILLRHETGILCSVDDDLKFLQPFCLSLSDNVQLDNNGSRRSEVILSVYIISFLIGLPANLLALYAFSDKIQSKPLPTDILLLNLTVSGLLLWIALPLKMHEAASGMKWNLPDFICSITSFAFFSTVYTSSLLLMASAHRQLQKPVYAIVIGAVIWRITLPSTTHLWLAKTSLCALRTSQKSNWKRFSLCSSLYFF